MQIGGYQIEIIVQGFPGKSVYHGGLGWSTVVLIRGHNRVAMIDAGSFGMRCQLIAALAQRGLRPANITDLLLTHSDYDHFVNWTLFRQARIAIGAEELEWAAKEPWGETTVPELYVRELQGWPTLRTISDGEEALPGIAAHIAPGHTPGHLIFVLAGDKHDVIFTGDAAKNRAELTSHQNNQPRDAARSADSIKMIWDLWCRRPSTIVVPGHDMPMIQENGTCRYIGHREAAIKAWFGDDLESTTIFELTAS